MHQARIIELYFTSVMILLGVILLMDGDTFSMAHYGDFRDTISENTAGAILLVAGTVRLIALAVNGVWRPSPLLRFIGCLIGMQFWALLAVAFWSAKTDVVPGILAFVVPAVFFEIFSGGRSMADAYRMRSFRLFRLRERATHYGG